MWFHVFSLSFVYIVMCDIVMWCDEHNVLKVKFVIDNISLHIWAFDPSGLAFFCFFSCWSHWLESWVLKLAPVPLYTEPTDLSLEACSSSIIHWAHWLESWSLLQFHYTLSSLTWVLKLAQLHYTLTWVLKLALVLFCTEAYRV